MAEALRVVRRGAVCLVLAWLCHGPLAAAASDERVILQLDIEQPRTFGYHIGDRFSRIVHLQLRRPYTLSTRALPAAGRFSEWLALEAPQVTSEQDAAATRYAIRFDYQVVNVGSEADSIAVPHHELAVSEGKETLTALIPATRINVTPLRGRDDTSLQADQAPGRLESDAGRLWLGAGVLALSVLALLHLHGGLPSWRAARPFGVAQRAVKAAGRRGWREEDYATALRAVHRAFDETAGRTVFADTLAGFFGEHGAFTTLREPVTEFYARSRHYFFASGAEGATARYSATELARLVAQCRDIERGLK